LQQRLRRGYLALADEQPERWVVLQNQDSLDKSVKRAVDLIRQAHREGAARAIAHFRGGMPPAAGSGKPLPGPAEALSAFLRVVDGLSQREPRVAAYMLGGMHGPHIDELRRALFEQAPDAVLAALTGLDDDESFRLRYLARKEHAGLTLRSLGLALETPRGWELWSELCELAPADALSCISGLDDPRAWQARLRWSEAQPALQQLTVGTLAGLDDDRAWELRERLLGERAAELATSYELSRVMAKSVTGLVSKRAWELRRQARRLAPVAALSSLSAVSDAESWQWRSESLRKAPKVVMGTLKGRFEAAAWEMRQAVAGDCKEALDGLQGVAGDEAWALREASQDVWPSTVVKTLASLADETRGQELVERQLRHYPDNVSLLKHVANIALGLHRRAPESV
jgi:hypothetical protein